MNTECAPPPLRPETRGGRPSRRFAWATRLRSVAFGLLTALACAASSRPVDAAQIRVFAAASLADALQEIARPYESSSGDKILFNFAGSNLLARQIEEGAPADIFFSADDFTMDSLDRHGWIISGTRRVRLSNTIVIVLPLGNPPGVVRQPADLTNAAIRRIAVADPQAVPAGVYARTRLQSPGLWTNIASKIVPTENVRGALAAVESGNVEAGLVYKTDAAISRKVRVACELPSAGAPEIHYPLALVRDTRQRIAAERFLRHLASREADSVFAKLGFIVRPGGTPP